MPSTITFKLENCAPVTIPIEHSPEEAKKLRPRRRGDMVLWANPLAPSPVPCRVTILLRRDGTWEWLRTEFVKWDNAHWNFANNGEYVGAALTEEDKKRLPPPAIGVKRHYVNGLAFDRLPPTEGQRDTVAKWFLGLEPAPYGCRLGGSLKNWAFAGFEDLEALCYHYGGKYCQPPPFTSARDPEISELEYRAERQRVSRVAAALGIVPPPRTFF